MSLVSTYCKLADGSWYKNPVWQDALADGTLWFICVDDNDPVELVIGHKDATAEQAEGVVKIFGLSPQLHRRSGRIGRLFGEPKDWSFTASRCWFLKHGEGVVKMIPTKHDGKSAQRPKGDCVYYDWSGNA